MTYKDIKQLNDKDIEFVNFAYGLLNSAKYPSFSKVTETYNSIFGTNLQSTSCAQCVRQRILEMKKAIDKFNENLMNDENTAPTP